MRYPTFFYTAIFILTPTLACAQTPTLWPSQQQWFHFAQQVQTDTNLRQAMDYQRHIADPALNATPQPVTTLITAGRLQGDPVKEQTQNALKDMDKIQALAVTYKMTHDPRYAAKASDFLVAWAKVNQPTGQPIDETGLEPAIFGYRLIRDEISTEQRARIDAWMQSIANKEIGSRDLTKATATNNWQSHRLKIVGMIGYVLGDPQLINYARKGFEAQINDNLRADGQSIDFIERDSLSYHVYDLRPLVTLALAFGENGNDLYHWRAPNGASVAHSVEWLKPYLTGEKNHNEFVGSRVAFDKARSQNHEKGHEVGALYDPGNAAPLLDLVTAYDKSYAPLAHKAGRQSFWLTLDSQQ